jgi:hypothetical protein
VDWVALLLGWASAGLRPKRYWADEVVLVLGCCGPGKFPSLFSSFYFIFSVLNLRFEFKLISALFCRF